MMLLRIRYLISLKRSGITDVFSILDVFSIMYLVFFKNQSWFLWLLTLNNVIIHIKLVLNKDRNHYCYKIYLEKLSYQLPKQ